MGAPPVFDGKSLEDAVKKGLQALGLSRAEAMITVIEEGSGGFLGFGARPYRVRITARPGGAIREPEERAPREGRERDRDRGGRGRRDRADRPRGRDDRGGEARSGEARSGEARSGEARSGEARGGSRDDRPRARDGRSGEGRGGEGRGAAGRGGEGRPKEAVAAGGERRPSCDDRSRGRDGRGAPRAAGGDSGERRDGRGDRRGPERGDLPRGEERRGGERRESGAQEPRVEERRPSVREGGRAPERPREETPEPVLGMGEAAVPAEGRDDDSGRRRRRRGRRGGRGRGGREGAPKELETGASQSMAAVADHPEESVMNETPFRQSEPMLQEAPFEPSEPVLREEPLLSHVAPEERPMRQDAPLRTEVAHDTPMMSNDALAAEGKRWTEELLAAMGFSAKVTAVADLDRVDVTVEVSEGDDLLTGAKGETRQALQHLLNRMVNRGEGTRYHLQLEINDFWKRREDELRDLAGRLAEEALASGSEAVTEYLNAQERRIVHVTLREDTRVKTYALGDGMIKRLAVAPADYEAGPREDED